MTHADLFLEERVGGGLEVDEGFALGGPCTAGVGAGPTSSASTPIEQTPLANAISSM